MDELMKGAGEKNTAYARYEALLLKRDQLLQESASIYRAYTKEFGELEYDIFKERIDCIHTKKVITACQAKINRSEAIDMDLIQAAAKQEMQLYYHTLKEMLREQEAAKDIRAIPEAIVQKAKRVYRRLAKMMHPDIFPETRNDKKLMDLWMRIVDAYHAFDVDELDHLMFLAKRLVGENGDSKDMDIPDIEERIAALKEEIADILDTEPYNYENYLVNEETRAERRKSLNEDLKELKDYHKELDEMLNKILMEGGVSIRWSMNLQ